MMARQGRDQAGARGDGARPARSSTRRRTSPRSPATTRTPRARCCRSRSTARRRCSITTRTRSRRRASIRTARRRRGRRSMAAAAKIKASGARSAPYTTGWPSWVQVENFSRVAQRAVRAPRRTASAGIDTEFEINGPLQVRHMENMKDWIKKGYFTYGGRKNEAEAKFYSGECAMMTSSSAAHGEHQAQRQVRVRRSSTLPYYADVAGAPQNTIIGGASAVGDGRQEARRVQGRREVPDVPVAAGSARRSGTRRPATCRSRMAAYEHHQEVGLLREEPRHRRRRSQQMIVKTTKQLARRALRQLRRRSAT